MPARLLLVLLSVLCIPSIAQTETPAGKPASHPINALLVTGGCCHDYDRQKLILTRGISARANVRWTVVQQGGKTTNTKIPLYNDPDWAKGFDIVVHNECFAAVKDKEFVDRILKPHREGTPAILIHCAMHCYRTGDDRWFEFVGMQSPGHGPHYTFAAENVKPEHPIMMSFGKSFTAPKGELYHSLKVFPTATPLASAKRRNDGKPQVCAWVNNYQPTVGITKGSELSGCRVFGTTIGHYNETMVEPQYLDLLARAMLWATKRDPVKDFTPASDETNAEIAKLVNIPVANKAAKYVPGNCCGDGNLAYGRPVTSKSVQNGNFRKHLTDGRLDTRWCPSGSQVDEWVTVDLEEPREVNHIRLHWEKPTGISYRYVVEVSTDNKTWKQVVDYSKNKKPGAVHAHKIDSKDVRYIRTTFLGADRGLWGSIWELEASADELPKLSNLDTSTPNNATISDVTAPPGFDVTLFGKPPEVNYPVCITASVNGEVFVGVDEQGSLGKEKGRGKVLRCIDTDGDGSADDIKVFAKVDHPRGLVYVGGGAFRAHAKGRESFSGDGRSEAREASEATSKTEVSGSSEKDSRPSPNGGSLWVLHPPTLSVYHDIDGDGVSDESEVLVTGISTNEVGKRGADHTTNGIAMGIDGWIYIAVGDYGFTNAVGKDGTTLSKRGGGVVRVRPDGTDMEIYSWGQRNIVDVALDPYMNIFTRDNTNDGGGWDIRLSHIMQTANYGYPSLYKNFTEEIMPPLADYGGGSGCGAMFFHDERWPDKFNNLLLTCDWGRSVVFSHNLPTNGPTFDAQQGDFLKLPRPTDICADGSGRMYVASWKNGKFNYDGPNIGFVAMMKPSGFVPKPVPRTTNLPAAELVAGLQHPSAIVRQGVQRSIVSAAALSQEIALAVSNFQQFGNLSIAAEALDPTLRDATEKARAELKARAERKGDRRREPAATEPAELPDYSGALKSLVNQKSAPLCSRVAAIYTLKEIEGSGSSPFLRTCSRDNDLREFCVRAMTDRLTQMDADDYDVVMEALSDPNPRVVAAAIVGIARLLDGVINGWKGGGEAPLNATHELAAAKKLLALTVIHPSNFGKAADDWRVPHVERVIPHLAVAALAKLNAHEVCFSELAKLSGSPGGSGRDFERGSLDALKLMHTSAVVSGLFKVLGSSRDDELRREVWTTLIRLYHREGDFVDGKSPRWWGTRPDTTGPYYHRVKWSESDRIAAAIRVALSEADESLAKHISEQLKRHVVKLDGLSSAEIAAMKEPKKAIAVPKADPNNPSQVGNMAYEEAVAAVLKVRGDGSRGQKLFVAQSCIACHTFANGQQPKGPHLVDIGKRSKPKEILESMLKPSKKMTQGFDTWTFVLESGKSYTGFVVLESAETITIRQTDGLAKEFPQDEVDERVKSEQSMMPAGIVSNLTTQQLADLLAYLQSLK